MPRLHVQKTYKLFIDGQFPRTESGRYYPVLGKNDSWLANVCTASKKDLRNAVHAARKAHPLWESKSPYARGQILYRMAEIVESRRASFIEEMVAVGIGRKSAQKECDTAIDTLVYYAGWCDKYLAVFSSVNPVSSNHFNFSVHEPMGVVAAVAPENEPLMGFVKTVAPILCGANSVVVLASHDQPTSALSFAEVIHSSDVPAGVVNVLSGELDELLPHMASHRDINALVLNRDGISNEATLSVASSIKRLIRWTPDRTANDPYKILDTQELKTTWHPIQRNLTGNSSY